jgi:hypothetical protein
MFRSTRVLVSHKFHPSHDSLSPSRVGESASQLLAGYDKGKEPSSKRQNIEIKRAKQRLTRWKAVQDRLAKQARPIGGARKRRGKRKS